MADDSVTLALCPIVGELRIAVAHKNSIVLTTESKTISVPTPQAVRALAFVPIAQRNANQTVNKSFVVNETTAETSHSLPDASSYLVTGGDDKVLTLLHYSGSTVTVVDTHGPVGKKVSHLFVVPTVGSASQSPFAALKAKAPTGIAPYEPNPSGSFATKEAPSVALADGDDEEKDDNNVKSSGLSAKDGYAVVAGRYYPNQVANVIFANKFGEVYAIALLQTPTGLVFGPAPVFLLQHFSVLSAMALVNGCNTSTGIPNNGRIVTCDRDAHTRVSKFPATFEIEQFLWGKYTKPAANETEAEPSEQAPIAAVVAGLESTTSLYTGDSTGKVTKWVSVGSAASPPQWTIEKELTSKVPAVASPTANYGGVVGLAVCNTHKAVLVARDHTNQLVAFFEDSRGASVSVPVPNNSSIVQLVGSSATGAIVGLLRDGSLYSIKVQRDGAPERVVFTSLAANISPVTAAIDSNWSESLKYVDLYASWKSQFAENKSKRDEEKSTVNERNKANPKTNGSKKK